MLTCRMLFWCCEREYTTIHAMTANKMGAPISA
jgi:hypothetical protein